MANAKVQRSMNKIAMELAMTPELNGRFNAEQCRAFLGALGGMLRRQEGRDSLILASSIADQAGRERKLWRTP